MFNFLKQNNSIEHQIQNGFTSNISGAIEHTSIMSHVMRKARIKQWSLVITLLDLKNVFGEFHYNLIRSVLSYHHIPSHVRALSSTLYLDFKTSIIKEEFQIPAISVHQGVLQGDGLSALLLIFASTHLFSLSKLRNTNILVSLSAMEVIACFN